ncbi:hypothetical protein [Streptomyces solicathayae]|uniref:Secreted protein n=1 Tax=Streptomyces solicathayae TaxID=3081768 RepID=A0ABZ0LKC6_9ACTN|nr:hypothetical protein [Streptomyces sp. HUAS YS2]WOX19884.1 hypothetical protein R2D22_00015 [Streptomyces sp. HUAS YS2]
MPTSTAEPAGARPVAPAEATTGRLGVGEAAVVTVVAAVTVLAVLSAPDPPGADPARGRRGLLLVGRRAGQLLAVRQLRDGEEAE